MIAELIAVLSSSSRTSTPEARACEVMIIPSGAAQLVVSTWYLRMAEGILRVTKTGFGTTRENALDGIFCSSSQRYIIYRRIPNGT